MKRDILLLVDADADNADVVWPVATLNRLRVRLVRTSYDFFQLIENGLTDVAIIVLDVDPGVHGMAVLEALDACDLTAPVIILSSLEEALLHPVAIAHGAKECFGKPVLTQRLRTAIGKFARAPEAQGRRCDAGGHPCEGCTERRRVPNESEAAFFAKEYQRGQAWNT